jgi:hypothetical protein
MSNLIQEGERKFRQNLSEADLEQMMPILLPGVDPEMLCYREVAFRIMVQQELLRSIRYCAYMSLVLIKLKNEKNPSTKFGEIVSIVRRNIRTTDLVGQFNSNDTLGIVLLNAPSGPTELVVNRVREEISMFMRDPGFADDHSRVISVLCPEEANSWEGLLSTADTKLDQ